MHALHPTPPKPKPTQAQPRPHSYTNQPWLSQLSAKVPELRKSSITMDGSKALPDWPENEDVVTRGVSLCASCPRMSWPLCCYVGWSCSSSWGAA